jgi:hypothetical protein
MKHRDGRTWAKASGKPEKDRAETAERPSTYEGEMRKDRDNTEKRSESLKPETKEELNIHQKRDSWKPAKS